uniref:Palmitoyl-protein thioesterase 1 n=1 Tax=Megaselia scalaris TaxID=36166 RepID=T1GKR8_MEGSC
MEIKTLSLIAIIILLLYYIQSQKAELTLTPVVLWHGMGDTCCLPFSLGHIATVIKENTAGSYVHSLKIGGNLIDDYKKTYPQPLTGLVGDPETSP